jgi:hypothetical protein
MVHTGTTGVMDLDVEIKNTERHGGNDTQMTEVRGQTGINGMRYSANGAAA